MRRGGDEPLHRGAGAGQGGFAEVSGKETLVFAGTVDLSASNVMVEYFSPSAASSPSYDVRSDALKKFKPESHAGMMEIAAAWGTPEQATQLQRYREAVSVLMPGEVVHAAFLTGDGRMVMAGGAEAYGASALGHTPAPGAA